MIQELIELEAAALALQLLRIYLYYTKPNTATQANQGTQASGSS